MIPVLFENNETEFVTQGIGALSDAVSCKVSEELNSSYELTMEYPLDGVLYKEIQMGRIILAVPGEGVQSQPFQIYKISRPINGIITIYAEHISYRLCYIPVYPFTASNCVTALQGLKENSKEENPFNVWTDKQVDATFSFSIPLSFRQCLGGIEGSILDTYKGEYEFDRWNVKLWVHRGTLKPSAMITYGKNLTDLKQEESIESTITGIAPYWKGNVTSGETSSEVVTILPEFVLETEYADKYPYKRTVPFDFSNYFQNQPTPDALRKVAQKYMKDNLDGKPTVNLEVSFASLTATEENRNFTSESVKIGDSVPVYFYKLGISTTAEIVATEYNVLANRYETLTLGSVNANLSKRITDINNTINSTVKKSDLETALSLAQTLISGGFGGYKVTNYVDGHPSEVVFGDTDNIATMKNCLRINKNGIAFSKNGYNGPYTSAWTIDGGLNGQFINFGSIYGDSIVAETLTIGKMDKNFQNEFGALQASDIEEVHVEYFKSDSPTIPPSQDADGWQQSTISYDSAHPYIWQRIVYKFKGISTPKYTFPSCSYATTEKHLNELRSKVQITTEGIKIIQSDDGSNYTFFRSDGLYIFVGNIIVSYYTSSGAFSPVLTVSTQMKLPHTQIEATTMHGVEVLGYFDLEGVN